MSTNFIETGNDHGLSELLEAQVVLSSESCSALADLTLAQICGPDFWAEFDHGESTRFGSLMKRLVATKRVPFVFIGTNSANHALYRLASEEV